MSLQVFSGGRLVAKLSPGSFVGEARGFGKAVEFIWALEEVDVDVWFLLKKDPS